MDTGRDRDELAQRTDDRAATDAAHDDLRSTADTAARTAERLAEIERRKLTLDPTDPELQQLSAEAVDLSGSLRLVTQAEAEITEELGESLER